MTANDAEGMKAGTESTKGRQETGHEDAALVRAYQKAAAGGAPAPGETGMSPADVEEATDAALDRGLTPGELLGDEEDKGE
jgi:hypothetical protein